VIASIRQGHFNLPDDQRIRRISGIAHPKVNHVDTSDPQLVLPLVNRPEQVRRQPTNSIGNGDGERVIFKEDFRFAAHDGLPGIKPQARPDGFECSLRTVE
jgi:hypothetical protein